MNAVQVAQLILTILMALRQAVGAAAELTDVLAADAAQLKELRLQLAKETAEALQALEKALADGN